MNVYEHVHVALANDLSTLLRALLLRLIDGVVIAADSLLLC